MNPGEAYEVNLVGNAEDQRYQICDSQSSSAERLLGNTLQLWELPESLRELYFLGEHYGYEHGLEDSYKRIEALENECDRLYTYASQGSFKTPMKPHRASYAELCRIRGETALAEQVEADWKLLLEDKTLSRRQLIEQRQNETRNK